MRIALNPRLDRSVGEIKGRRGFALIITLSLMMLLSMLAVGALVLSSSALRSAARSTAQGEAQANARMALALALGELQLQMGPDQRVSANADILAEAGVTNPHWTGVWDSWRAGEGEPSQHQTIRPDAAGANHQMSPAYTPNRQDYFRSWLVSLPPEELANVVAGRTLAINGSAAPDSDSVAVQLVGPGSLGTDAADGVVSAPLIAVAGDDEASQARSRFGWWVGDESQKAHIMPDSYAGDGELSLAERVFRTQAPGSTGTSRIPGLSSVADETVPGSIPSVRSLDLIAGVEGSPSESFHAITSHSYAPLADVREGGLKRDLSVLLERPISLAEFQQNPDDFMLYQFRTKDQWLTGHGNQEMVPLQDLSAYYQLYDGSRTDWGRGLQYSSNALADATQVVSPDFGSGAQVDFARQYTTLYRQPMPVKVQFLLSLFAEPISPEPEPSATDPTPNTHLLRVGITPSITLWNSNNVPLTMNFGSNPQRFAQLMRMGMLPLRIRWIKNDGEFISNPQHLTWFAYSAGGGKAHLFNLYFSGKRPIAFEPGEFKVFSLPFTGDVSGIKQSGDGHINFYRQEFLFKTDKYFEGHEVIPGWEPRGFMLFNRSSPGTAPHVIGNKLAFKGSDRISFEVTADNPDLPSGDGTTGAALSFFMIQSNHQSYFRYGGTQKWGFRHLIYDSRNGTGATQINFNRALVTKGFPGQAQTIGSEARSGANIITRSEFQEGWPFLQFSLFGGVETSENSNGGIAGGRKFASRPFLHSSPLGPFFLDDHSGDALYNSGWNWNISEINDVFEAPVQTSATNQGFFGGGYTPESGTTHAVQQEIPVAPVISIGSLSHARLGGFSLANQPNPFTAVKQAITATGQAGLFPDTLQAIGNSYAHPLLGPGDAFQVIQQVFNHSEGARSVILADHSYLANKALWDDFFFSSIIEQPSSVRSYNGSNLTARQVAQAFFDGEGELPNRRMVPYTANMDDPRMEELFSQADRFRDGLADKIAAHLMVQGPFNINSTSALAWRGLLSSLKGKPVAYRTPADAMSGTEADTATPEGVPVSGFGLANGQPQTGSPSDPSEPGQWLGWRELTDDEINELAEAMVRQVKARGPFLSLSEFVNRRLDPTNRELSVKGALQAAIDDSEVSINDGFRSQARQFSSDEKNSVNAVFPEALDGPVAYGSSAYVDQADILRNFAGQLTPRGDTFVIRTYGDSVDGGGNVVARAWCEAVVQRVPDYVDGTDEPHLPQAELDSEANKNFGRKFRIVSFRWLNSSEI